MSTQPFFTIGVPTYNRHGLLIKTLESILAQNFTDFEVIVGNDYTAEILTGEMLGITDPRIRFVNHPVNLREVGNMNALMASANGRYFTWLFDDDLFESDFLNIGYQALVQNNFPDAFFSSYRVITDNNTPEPLAVLLPSPELFSGREFLLRYSASRPDIISTCGLFRTDQLLNITGGLEQLSESKMGLYCEYLLLVCCGLLENIVFINAPLVIFRAHSGSWGENNMELGIYPATGRKLIQRCKQVLDIPKFTDVNNNILMEICRTHLFTYFHRVVQYELALKNSKLIYALRYRQKYFREVYNTAVLFAELTGQSFLYCLFIFRGFIKKHHIFTPDWNSIVPEITTEIARDE